MGNGESRLTQAERWSHGLFRGAMIFLIAGFLPLAGCKRPPPAGGQAEVEMASHKDSLKRVKSSSFTAQDTTELLRKLGFHRERPKIGEAEKSPPLVDPGPPNWRVAPSPSGNVRWAWIYNSFHSSTRQPEEFDKFEYIQTTRFGSGRYLKLWDGTRSDRLCSDIIFVPVNITSNGRSILIGLDRAFKKIEARPESDRVFLLLSGEDSCTTEEWDAAEQTGDVCTANTGVVLELSGQRRLTGKLRNGKTVFDVMLSGDSLLPVIEEERVNCPLAM